MKMTKDIKIYTTPNCGICKMAKKKMKDKNIPFEEYNLVEYAEKLNIYSAPVLEISENTYLTSPIEINKWINEQ